MTGYITRRAFFMLITLVMVSIVGFLIIQLPQGDYMSSYLRRLGLTAQNNHLIRAELERLREFYGLDKPVYQQYLVWAGNMVQGNMGMSFANHQPVSDMLMDRLPLTVLVSILTLFLTYIVAIPIGIYSATHQYSIGDYSATVFGFVGLATPNFLLALILMWLSWSWFDFSISGLFSSDYLDASWSLGKVIDMMLHLPVAIVVVATAGTAGLIRVMRSTLLDELQKQYVITARSKGLPESKLLFKYPVRIAINPLISTVGWILPEIVSGSIITAIVLNLPTVGPMLYSALLIEDMQVAASIVMVLSVLTVIGTFVSDMLLVVVDPRIRYGSERSRNTA